MGAPLNRKDGPVPGGVIEWVCELTGWIAGGLAIIMMLAIIREVIGRYAFNRPTDWAVDLNAFLLVAMVYLGAAYTTSIDGHVRADFLYGKFKGRTKAAIDLVIDLLSILYASILVWEGWLLAWDSFVNNEVSTGGVRWPLFPFQAFVPVGALIVLFLLLRRIAANARLLWTRSAAAVTEKEA